MCLVGKAKFLDDDAYVKEGLAILKFHDGMPATTAARTVRTSSKLSDRILRMHFYDVIIVILSNKRTSNPGT